ncbi:bestrophin-like domain, partial [Belnapia arida]
ATPKPRQPDGRSPPHWTLTPHHRTLTFIFVSFGLNAPRNAVVVGTFAVCSYAVGAAVFLILEMEEPFDGLIQAAKHPMEIALARMGR